MANSRDFFLSAFHRSLAKINRFMLYLLDPAVVRRASRAPIQISYDFFYYADLYYIAGCILG